jgi:hypothetical protein
MRPGPPTRYPSPAIGTNRRYASGRDERTRARPSLPNLATVRAGLRTPRTRRSLPVRELSAHAFNEEPTIAQLADA